MFFAPLSIITNPFLVAMSESRPNIMFIRKIYGPGLATLNFIFAMYSQKKSFMRTVTTKRNEIPTTKSPVDVM
jgi:hypothetical protein